MEHYNINIIYKKLNVQTSCRVKVCFAEVYFRFPWLTTL